MCLTQASGRTQKLEAQEHSVPKSKILLLTTGKLGLNGLLISTLWGFRKWPPLNPEKSGLEENRF